MHSLSPPHHITPRHHHHPHHQHVSAPASSAHTCRRQDRTGILRRRRAAAEDAGAILPTNYCFLFANMRNFQ